MDHFVLLRARNKEEEHGFRSVQRTTSERSLRVPRSMSPMSVTP